MADKFIYVEEREVFINTRQIIRFRIRKFEDESTVIWKIFVTHKDEDGEHCFDVLSSPFLSEKTARHFLEKKGLLI